MPPDRPTGETDHELIVRIRAGDVDAFSIVYHAFYAGLYRFAVRQLETDDSAHDVVHAVFWGVWTGRERWAPASLKAYLYGAVRHEAQKIRRHQAVVQRTLPVVTEEYVISSPSIRPDEAVEFAELRQRVRRAIGQLPGRQRMAMQLRWVEGMTIPEIAEAMGVSHPPVVRLLAKGQAALRRVLAEPDDVRGEE